MEVAMSNWLERELTHQLAAVAAPESLWDRIQEGRAPREGRAFEWTWSRWPIAAALALVIGGGAAWQIAKAHNPAAGMQALALEQLQGFGADLQHLDFRSADPAAIGAWVNTEANIPLHLPVGNGAVRLLGARMIARGETPIAAIAYQVGGVRATLLVSRTAPENRASPPGHTFAKVDRAGNSSYSWRMGEQMYTMASLGKDPQAGCLLCHADGERLTAVN
jgi:hypothetical protein